MRNSKKVLSLWLLILVCLLGTGCGSSQDQFQISGDTNEDSLQGAQAEIEQDTQTEGTQEEDRNTTGETDMQQDGTTPIWVQITGAVNSPGVYELKEGDRIMDVVAAAGGFLPDAVLESINQAEFLADSDAIYVFDKTSWQSQDNPQIAGSKKDSSATATNLVNLNTATKEELMTLTGIGETKAASIIQYREENGSFRKIDDLMKVPGIKEGVYQKVKDQITAP